MVEIREAIKAQSVDIARMIMMAMTGDAAYISAKKDMTWMTSNA